MWGTCKIVNFSWLLFSTLVIGQNLLTQKNTLSKWSVNTFYCVNGLHVGLGILCLKMRTFLCGKAPLTHNKRNCYPPYQDHYLMDIKESFFYFLCICTTCFKSVSIWRGFSSSFFFFVRECRLIKVQCTLLFCIYFSIK